LQMRRTDGITHTGASLMDVLAPMSLDFAADLRGGIERPRLSGVVVVAGIFDGVDDLPPFAGVSAPFLGVVVTGRGGVPETAVLTWRLGRAEPLGSA
jgi:hypothetical protein